VLWPWWRPRRTGATGRPTVSRRRKAAGALALAGYALPFSLAYVAMGAATGALLLFGASS
jgi:hypothetical protein